MLRSLWRRALREPIPSPLQGRAACFRSTAIVCAKWKNKFHRKEDIEGQRTPKNYIRYVVRQKRADAKQALKDLLNGRSSNPFFYEQTATWHAEAEDHASNGAEAANQAQSRTRRRPRRFRRNACRKNTRSFYPDDDDDDDDDDDPNVGQFFQARFGSRCYTWSFQPSHDPESSNPFPGFQWRDETDDERRDWERESDLDDDDHDQEGSKMVGLWSQRATLGLPTTGPLKIGDVKIAFRMSALKWHPDRHQGPSQTVAEEQFKRCLDAYKSLCDALTST